MVSVTWPLKFPSISLPDLRGSVSTRPARTRVLLARITNTPFTLIYFLLALLTCFVMVSLQLVLYTDNTLAVQKISGIVASANLSQGLAVNANGVLQYCERVNGSDAAQCVPITSPPTNNGTGFILTWKRQLQNPESDVEDETTTRPSKQTLPADKTPPTRISLPQSARTPSNNTQVSTNCSKALFWLEGTLNDARREDVITFTFQFWLFSLSVIAILSESIPHLGAALFGHILGTVWAGFRVRSSYTMMDIYNNAIVADACQGNNLLGNWWQVRVSHAVPVAVVNGIALVFLLFLSFKVYKVFSIRTFSFVGAAPLIDRILKIVLLYSVTLHLAMFFVIASTAAWINKATNSTISFLATDVTTSVVGPVVTILLVIPWTILGWVCVRRECKWRFLLLSVLSIVLLTIFTSLFWSGLYRFVFSSWPFFTTITVTAYVLVVFSLILAIWCRFNFGHGFAHFIQVCKVLENMDFPTVQFSKGADPEAGVKPAPKSMLLEIPPMPSDPSGPPAPRNGTFMRASVYSNYNVATVKLSSSQPLHSETQHSSLSPTPSVTSVTQRLRKVFEYRKAQEPKSTPPSPGVQIQTSSLVQPDEVPVPPLPKPAEDEIIIVKRKNEKSKRRSRSVSFGRTSSIWTRDAMQTITESDVLEIPAEKVPQRQRGSRPLPIRPLPRPPASAPTPSTSGSTPPLARRGGVREPGPNHRLDQVDLRPVEQW